MGGRRIRGDELEREASRYAHGHIDLNDKQARKLAADLLHEFTLLKQQAKAAEQALDAVIAGRQ